MADVSGSSSSDSSACFNDVSASESSAYRQDQECNEQESDIQESRRTVDSEQSRNKLEADNNRIAAAQLSVAQFNTLSPEANLAQVSQIKPIALAYLGDAVFELYVRSQLLHPPKRIRDYHQQVVSRVKAERQAYYADVLVEHLTAFEKDLLRRGRNATVGKNRRARGQDYQKATGLEALIGFLYLSDLPRLLELLSYLKIDSLENTAINSSLEDRAT